MFLIVIHSYSSILVSVYLSIISLFNSHDHFNAAKVVVYYFKRILL